MAIITIQWCHGRHLSPYTPTFRPPNFAQCDLYSSLLDTLDITTIILTPVVQFLFSLFTVVPEPTGLPGETPMMHRRSSIHSVRIY